MRGIVSRKDIPLGQEKSLKQSPTIDLNIYIYINKSAQKQGTDCISFNFNSLCWVPEIASLTLSRARMNEITFSHTHTHGL